MTRQLANWAGIAAVTIAALRVIIDIEGSDGGWQMPTALRSLSVALICVLLLCWVVEHIVDAAFTRRHALMRELVREAVAEQLAETLEEFGGAMFRSGQISGATRLVERPHVVSRNGD